MPRESDIHPHVPAERADLFTADDGGSTEHEYLNLLAALVRATKPQSVLETGAWKGAGTLALAEALDANGFGHLVSIERDSSEAIAAMARVEQACLEDVVTIVRADASEYLANAERHFDFAFFDSELNQRCRECAIATDRGLIRAGAYVAFHDTSTLRTWDGKPDPAAAEFRQAWGLLRHRFREVIEFPLSRGLIVARL